MLCNNRDTTIKHNDNDTIVTLFSVIFRFLREITREKWQESLYQLLSDR